MKSIPAWIAALLIFAACSTPPAEQAPPPPEPVSLPVEFTYKGATTLGDMKNVQIVTTFQKRLNDLNPDVAEFIADTVTVHFADGNNVTAPRDSMVAEIKGWLGNLSAMKIEYTSAVALDVKEQGHEWVLSWTDETYTMKDGSVEHVFLHEDYRLKDGKIVEVFQYSAKAAPPSTPSTP
jgi:hypothetical protein